MRIAGYQPQYFPRLHYYNRALDSDVFEISDYVQFVKKHAFFNDDGTKRRDKSFQAHCPIKISTGVFYLSIPVKDDLLPINQTRIGTDEWASKHLKTIESGYSKSVNFTRYYPEIEEIISSLHTNLSSLTTKTVLWGILRLITDERVKTDEIDVETVNNAIKEIEHPFRLKSVFLASESSIPPPSKGEATDWIISLCKYAEADDYFYGATSHQAYMEPEKFLKNGISLSLQNWKCAPYPQQFPKTEFIPNLSILDLVMNTDLKKRQEVVG